MLGLGELAAKANGNDVANPTPSQLKEAGQSAEDVADHVIGITVDRFARSEQEQAMKAATRAAGKIGWDDVTPELRTYPSGDPYVSVSVGSASATAEEVMAELEAW